jgi:hypothetical protein
MESSRTCIRDYCHFWTAIAVYICLAQEKGMLSAQCFNVTGRARILLLKRAADNVALCNTSQSPAGRISLDMPTIRKLTG